MCVCVCSWYIGIGMSSVGEGGGGGEGASDDVDEVDVDETGVGYIPATAPHRFGRGHRGCSVKTNSARCKCTAPGWRNGLFLLEELLKTLPDIALCDRCTSHCEHKSGKACHWHAWWESELRRVASLRTSCSARKSRRDLDRAADLKAADALKSSWETFLRTHTPVDHAAASPGAAVEDDANGAPAATAAAAAAAAATAAAADADDDGDEKAAHAHASNAAGTHSLIMAIV
jgi:hypothetical protein